LITVVSGLPRSGTSLMMQILEANGFEILTDSIRTADESNLRGYYEYEKVKSLMKDNTWLAEAEGKTVKVIAQLLPYLHSSFEYKIIFMQRKIAEILSSQSKNVRENGKPEKDFSRYTYEDFSCTGRKICKLDKNAAKYSAYKYFF